MITVTSTSRSNSTGLNGVSNPSQVAPFNVVTAVVDDKKNVRIHITPSKIGENRAPPNTKVFNNVLKDKEVMDKNTVMLCHHSIVRSDTPPQLVKEGTFRITNGVDICLEIGNVLPKKPTRTFGMTMNTIFVEETLDLGQLIADFNGSVTFPTATTRRCAQLVEENAETHIL